MTTKEKITKYYLLFLCVITILLIVYCCYFIVDYMVIEKYRVDACYDSEVVKFSKKEVELHFNIILSGDRKSTRLNSSH